MRECLSQLLADESSKDDRLIVLSGDHGYSLFDAIRQNHPTQFLNVGVAEQNMIGLAAGLARVGFHPCVYGLAAFVPIRVLEQIKLDLCFSRAPVILLGDGAGLVYSTLGVSHQCGEDIACLRPLPGISIFSPCDDHELRASWADARRSGGPSYIRIGKADRPPVHVSPLPDTEPVRTAEGVAGHDDAIVLCTGSTVHVCTEWCRLRGIACVSIPRIKPFPARLLPWLEQHRKAMVVEEHCRSGGLWSAILEHCAMLPDGRPRPGRMTSIALSDEFTKTCGSYQHALGEHDMSDSRVRERLDEWLGLAR